MRPITIPDDESRSFAETSSPGPDDRQLYQATMDQLTEARCPLCRRPFVVRFDCLGPYFACLPAAAMWKVPSFKRSPAPDNRSLGE